MINKTENLTFRIAERLNDYTNFREFEKEYEGEIFYADGSAGSVLEAIENEPEFDVEVYLFDGWFVAMHAGHIDFYDSALSKLKLKREEVRDRIINRKIERSDWSDVREILENGWIGTKNMTDDDLIKAYDFMFEDDIEIIN